MGARARTKDVRGELGSFRDLLLPDALVKSLELAGYTKPSPVQQQAIPLGRLGADLIVQAKSGTGKTVVFSTVCLDRLDVSASMPQALIIAPTRELALQSCDVLTKLAGGLPEPHASVAAFVGGLPMINDEKRLRRTCHVVVGTPGRIAALAQNGTLKLEAIKMFVLDEADQLLAEAFYPDVTWIYDQLPKRKQARPSAGRPGSLHGPTRPRLPLHETPPSPQAAPARQTPRHAAPPAPAAGDRLLGHVHARHAGRLGGVDEAPAAGDDVRGDGVAARRAPVLQVGVGSPASPWLRVRALLGECRLGPWAAGLLGCWAAGLRGRRR
jgi:hypothetical protein